MKYLKILFFIISLSASSQVIGVDILNRNKLTTVEMNSITVAQGLKDGSEILNTDTNTIWRYDGTQWNNTGTGGGGVTDHGGLSGLGDDDHAQYFNQARGDARYLQTEVDGSITNELQTISKVGSTVTLSDGGGSFTDDNTQRTDEEIEDIIGNRLIGGTNTTVVYDDVSGETTINSTGSGGSDVVDPLSPVSPLIWGPGPKDEFYADYPFPSTTFPSNGIAFITDSIAPAPSFDSLSDISKGSPATNSSSTLRVLADPDSDGNYNEIDWTPPVGGGGDFLANGTVPMTGNLQLGNNNINGLDDLVFADQDGNGHQLTTSIFNTQDFGLVPNGLAPKVLGYDFISQRWEIESSEILTQSTGVRKDAANVLSNDFTLRNSNLAGITIDGQSDTTTLQGGENGVSSIELSLFDNTAIIDIESNGIGADYTFNGTTDDPTDVLTRAAGDALYSSGGSSPISTANVTISNPDMSGGAVDTTIVPAQGANTIIVPIYAEWIASGVSGGTGNQTLIVRRDGADIRSVIFALSSTSNSNGNLDVSNTVNYNNTTGVNAPLEIRLTSANLDNLTANIDVRVYYWVQDLTNGF